MARKVITYIEITDDFDRESRADETVEIAVDGMVYELDLQNVRAKEIREFLKPYQEVAHDQWKMPPRPGKKKRKSVTAQAITEVPKPEPSNRNETYVAMMADREARMYIRDWAEENGYECSRTGQIGTETLQAFIESNPDAYVPETTLKNAGLA